MMASAQTIPTPVRLTRAGSCVMIAGALGAGSSPCSLTHGGVVSSTSGSCTSRRCLCQWGHVTSEENVTQVFRFFLASATSLSYSKSFVPAHFMPYSSKSGINRSSRSSIALVRTLFKVF
eukprot:65543-Amphidinium_carterae.1